MFRRSYITASAVRAFRRYRLSSWHHRLVKEYRLTYFHSDEPTRSELRARDLLHRAEAAASWVPKPLFPAGGAAGPLLCYLIIRTLTELPVRHVLELGAGQTTRLLGAWAQSGGRHVVTFEHDRHWADTMRSTVDPETSSVFHLPLVRQSGPSGFVDWYSSPPSEALPAQGFDLIVVDGPVGTARFSRYGIVDHIPEWVGQDWALLWDDLDRPSDLESFGLLIQRLTKLGVEHDHVLLDGDRTVGVVYTPGFTSLRYMW